MPRQLCAVTRPFTISLSVGWRRISPAPGLQVHQHLWWRKQQKAFSEATREVGMLHRRLSELSSGSSDGGQSPPDLLGIRGVKFVDGQKQHDAERISPQSETTEEVREWRPFGHKHVEKQCFPEQKAKEEALTWQQKEAQQLCALRVKAEAVAAEWENKAEQEESLRKRAEKAAAESKQQAEQEKRLRRKWEELAEAQETLRAEYQQKAQDEEEKFHQQKAQQEAEASALVWQNKAERMESQIAALEHELQQWKQKAEAEAEEKMRQTAEESVCPEREQKATQGSREGTETKKAESLLEDLGKALALVFTVTTLATLLCILLLS